MILQFKRLIIFIEMKQFLFYFEKKSKWPTQKNLTFQLRQFSIFHGLVLGLVELIDAKGIDVALPGLSFSHVYLISNPFLFPVLSDLKCTPATFDAEV